MPAQASLQRLRPQTPLYAPSHHASPSTGVAASAVAHQGRRWATLLAAAQIIRVKSAMAQLRTIHASALSLSRTGRDAADRAGPSPSACWSDAPHPPATQCGARRGTAPSSAPWAASLRPRLDGQRFQPALADTRGSFATIGPGPRWRVAPSPGAAPPRWSAHPRDEATLRRYRRSCREPVCERRKASHASSSDCATNWSGRCARAIQPGPPTIVGPPPGRAPSFGDVADFAGAIQSGQLGDECGQCVPGIKCHAREGSEDVEVEASARIDGLHCRDDRPQQMCAPAVPPRRWRRRREIVRHSGPNENIMLDTSRRS